MWRGVIKSVELHIPDRKSPYMDKNEKDNFEGW